MTQSRPSRAQVLPRLPTGGWGCRLNSNSSDPTAAIHIDQVGVVVFRPSNRCHAIKACLRFENGRRFQLIYGPVQSRASFGRRARLVICRNARKCSLLAFDGPLEGMAFVSHLRVLIIDDSLTIRAMLEELIEREEGCRVVGMASSGNDARSMMIDLVPTVATLDLNMPGIDGLTFLDQLSGKVHVPVVVVSSATSAGSPQAAEAIKRGAYACFDKANILSETTKLVRLLKAAAKAGSTKAARSASA